MKKIFITGSNGFIGRNLKEYLQNNYEVFAPKRNELDLLDQFSVEKFLQKNQFDIVIHTATHNATVVSNVDRRLVLNNNLRMFYSLEKYHALYGKMFYFGSGAEYDRSEMEPKVREEDFGKIIPKDDYGFSKYVMNKTAEQSKNVYNLRLFGVYGKYEDWRIRFISDNICRALRGESYSLNHHVKFDYLYIDDLCSLTKCFMETELQYHVYNVCTGMSIDLYDIAVKLKKEMKMNLPIVIKDDGWKKEYSGDNTRMLSELGKYKFIKMEKAIAELVEWYRKKEYI